MNLKRRAANLVLAAVCLGWPALACQVEAAEFPLRVSANHRFLEDQKAEPFLIAADHAERLLHGLTIPETARYLDVRRSEGFNAVVVRLLPGQPKSRDLIAPNEKFFVRVDKVLQLARDGGFLVMLEPAWLGRDETGWSAVLKRSGATKCREFGREVGKRLAKHANLLWVMGGERDPEEYREVINALAEGVREGNSNALFTAQAGSPHSSLDAYAQEKWLGVNATFTYSPEITDAGRAQQYVYAAASRDFNRAPVMPFFLIQSTYEPAAAGSDARLRNQVWWTLLSGAAGHAFGNEATSQMGKQWEEALRSNGSLDMARAYQFFRQYRWTELVPDQEQRIVTGGRGVYDGSVTRDAKHRVGSDYVTAASTRDGKVLIAYLPTTKAVTVDLSKLATKRVAHWFDPSEGARQLARKAEGSEGAFVPPGLNARGGSDWVLVIEAE